MAKSLPMLGTFSSYVASILEIPSYLYIFCTRILNSRDNKEVCFTYKFLGSYSNPRGLGCVHNTERALALPSAKPSLPRGLQRGEPLNVPKMSLFFEKISGKNVTFWGHLGVPPVVAPEGGSTLMRAKPRLSQCCVRIRAPEGSEDSRENYK